MLVASDNFN